MMQHTDELKQFSKVLSTSSKGSAALTTSSVIRNSLHLLEDVSGARYAILDFFECVAEISVKNYVNKANIDTVTGLLVHYGKNNPNQELIADTTFENIQETLEKLVSKGAPGWAPLIASWSLELVGKLSEKYSKRKMTIDATCNFWLNCNTMRGILTVISVCFRKLTNPDAESCAEALMAAFQRNSVTFDWVVARLGGCFPLKIISQILQCSLQKFDADPRSHFDSEIAVLDYLSFTHEQELKVALREMLQDGFELKKSSDALIVPFLMAFSNYSDALLKNIVSVFLEMYNDELLATIIRRTPLWMANKVFAEMQPSLNNVALRLKVHGAKLLISVAKMADQHIWCQDFLEYTLQELEQVLLSAQVCPLMDDLVTEDSKYLLWSSCLSTNVYEQQTAVRLLLIISSHHSHFYYQTISELLRKSYEVNQSGVGAVIRIIGGQSGLVRYPDIKPGLQMVLEDVLLEEQFQHTRLSTTNGSSEALNTFHNLNTLTKMQKRNLFPYIKQQLLVNDLNDCLPKILHILEVTLQKLLLHMDEEAAKGNIEGIANLESINQARKKIKIEGGGDVEMYEADLQDTPAKKKQRQRLALAHTIIELLNTIEAGAKTNAMRTTEMLKLSILSVKYFFIALAERNAVTRRTSVNGAFMLLQRLCGARKTARTICLRELVEGALFYYGYLFGQIEDSDEEVLSIPEHETVLSQNHRQSLGPTSYRTVLHAGLIGRGLRAASNKRSVECDPVIQKLFLKALDCCCADLDIEGYSLISLLLVELVSTDVMYNGLPFPEEEFTKVTMERDLLIRRAFMTSPILWALLGFIATHRPALCFSSVLLRALNATCLHQWRAKNVNKFQPMDPKDELMQCTKKLLEIMAMGQLLPAPLSNLHMIIEYFEAPEIALLLKECVWNYLKDHVPSPALFCVDNTSLHWRNPSLLKVPPQYVDTLRNLMQKKLPKLGQYYHQMFIMPEINNFADAAATEINVGVNNI